jgi:hypothetical protein
MSLTLKERAVFLERTANSFWTLRQQAREAGKIVTYKLDDLRGLVERTLGDRGCPYCRGPVTVGSFVTGCKVPLERGGRGSFRNLEVFCTDCHVLKGILDASEYREMLQLVQSWAKPVRNHFLARLRSGHATGLPRPGCLEWFTGAPAPRRCLGLRRRPSLDEESAHEVSHD